MKLTESEYLVCTAISGEAHDVRNLAARQLLAAIGDDRAFSLMQQNQIAALVAHALMGSPGKPEATSLWHEVHKEASDRISAYLAELDRLASTLLGENIKLVALKNGGIARAIFPCPGCCPMGDLDVLVERKHFRQVARALIQEGYQLAIKPPLARDDLAGAEMSGVAEFRKTITDRLELELELHWRVATGRWIRPDQEPTAEELMSRSIPIPVTAVRLLAPEDNLLQVALHTAKHTYVRAPGLRLHLDVERIVRAYPDLDWGLFLLRVKSLQVKTAVYFSLIIPHDIFGTPIPQQVLTDLRPPLWKERLILRWLERVGIFNPDERKFSNPGYIVFNSLLYDDFRGLWRALIPDRAWMYQRYAFHNNLLLPYYHGRRLLDLALRRVST